MGYSVNIDYDNVTIGFKRTIDCVTEEPYKEQPSKYPFSDIHTSNDVTDIGDSDYKTLIKLIPRVISVLKEMQRSEDFISVLESIAPKKLQGNIALHLLLDVGQFLRQDTVHSMRYSETTKEFWTLVHKMFKGKAVRFFTGEKGEGTKTEVGMLCIPPIL